MRSSHLFAATALAGIVAGLTFPTLAAAQATPNTPSADQVATATAAQTTPSSTQPDKARDPLGSGQTVAGSASTPDAAALEQGPAQGGNQDDQDVVVTGTRIRRASGTLSEAVPVTSVSAAELLGSRGSSSVGDALNQLPQLRSTFSQANSTASIGTAGLNLLDLRGLGVNRTLTLVNGRRVVTSVPGSYTPDVNTIPSDLIERVDIVTGGNSAIYGSDAVAGVVNFVLRRDFEGVRVKAQDGITTYGDRGDRLVSAIVGHNFDDGKINVTAAVQYSKADPLFYSDRDYRGAFTGVPGFVNAEPTTLLNRNSDGISNTAFTRGITFGNISTGGYLTTSCPAATATNAARRAAVCSPTFSPGTNGVLGAPGVAGSSQLAYNYAFLPDGTLARDDPAHGLVDRRATSGGISGGLSATGVENAMLDPGLENITGSFLTHADFSDAFKVFAEASYTRVNALQQSVQPTFANGGTLSNTFLLTNPFLTPQAVSTLQTILAPGATSFQSSRFNNDIGTRAEEHKRDTYRAVLGVEGDISHTANLHYEVAFNYGRTENDYHTGGNVLIANYNKAVNAVLAPANYAGSNYVLNASGQKVICAVNATVGAANDAGCYPLNTFGYGAGDPRAVNYVLFNSERRQWAQEVDGTAFLSGDSTGLFHLPGGPVAFVLGGEYRQEKAYSNYDPTTDAGLTFLNGSSPFAPPAVNIKEAFGELNVPLLKNLPGIRELSIQGAGRVSDYGGATGSVVAWDAGVTWAPIHDARFKATLSRSVRAPNLSNLYATPAVTYANGLTDPCDQIGNPGGNASNNVASGPNRAKNCAAAGIPTTLTYTDQSTGALLTVPWYNVSGSGVAGSNQGNPALVPEVGYSFTVSGIFEPQMIPGLSFGATYYNIRVVNVIQSLSGQQIINRCYDDAGGINNPFCAVVFRRSGTGNPLTDFTFNGETTRQLVGQPNVNFTTVGNGLGFIAQPFNFARLATRGIDVEATYRHSFMQDLTLTYHLTASYVMDRLSYSYIAEPTRYDRIDSTLGDPKWQGAFNLQAKFRAFDFSYNLRYIGKQIVSGASYETFYSSQGRPAINPETRPFIYYNAEVYHNFRLGVDATDKYHFYVGVDNATNVLPPYELSGNGNTANGEAIFPNIGRFLYAGVEAKF